MTQSDLINFLKRAMQPLKDRVLLMAGRAILMAVKDDKAIQQVQVSALAGETMDKVESYQQFGFTSNPPPGTEGIILALGGNRENMVLIATDNRELRKKNLEKGESAFYTHDGTYIYLKKDGQIEIKTATKITVDCPETEFKGKVIINDTLLVKEDATFMKNINVILNAKVTLLVQAGGYTGPAGASPGPVVINVPVTLGATAPVLSSAAITTTANVTGGGTDMASIKSTFNAHTHPDGSPNSGTPNSAL
jgi:phage baseplate assembly protein V